MVKSWRSRKVAPAATNLHPGYPAVHAGQPADASRRRFLRQIAMGGGALGVFPGSSMARAQEPEIDYSVLGEHEITSAAEPAVEEDEVWVTEHRALWIDPGYLLLLEWSRPASDETPIAGLEAMSEALSAYLTEQSSSSSALHDIDHVTALERAIVIMLAPEVAPATIEVVHLDHDCNILCGAAEVDPVISHPPTMVRGRRR